MRVDPSAVIERLRALDQRSGGRRVAWSAVWSGERPRLANDLAALPGVGVETDAAGNLWATLRGRRPETLVLGSHLDCVPDGGWLDGCLGVMVAAELLATAAHAGSPPCTLAVVDWADEEGSRFGHSLLGSSAAAGLLTSRDLAGLVDHEGIPIAAVLAEHGVNLQTVNDAGARLTWVGAYLELHIEQGPVLEAQGRSCAAVKGCGGARRMRLTFSGEAGHAGTVPMEHRRDPVRAAAEFIATALRRARDDGGLATVGELQARPGTPTAIATACHATLDVRHADVGALDRLEAAAVETAHAAAHDTGTTLGIEPLWSIDPIAFDSGLVADAIRHTDGRPALTSGALHDAAALARVGIPTAMVFVASRAGISHSRAEDTSDAALHTAITAFVALASSTMQRLEAGRLARSPG
jgi:N-carbamoyl-L-amino-acid hydrolase